jgi:uncharacterized BrkB/YihY/UPF0761 family membrane protein
VRPDHRVGERPRVDCHRNLQARRNRMRALRVVLVVVGLLCAMSVIGVLVPWSALGRIMQFWGLEPPPADPLVVYWARVSCLLAGLIGVFFLVLSSDPVRYRPMLVLGTIGLFLTGVVCLITGWTTGLRPAGYLADAAVCLIGAILICAFWPRVPRSA